MKAAVERKEVALKDFLGAMNEVGTERYICQSKKEVIQQFGRKMNQDVDGNRKLFCKELSEED